MARFSVAAGSLLILLVAAPATAACTNPEGKLSQVVFNAEQDVFQGCTAAGWQSFDARGTVPVADGLVGYWRLDETSGTIKDYSVSGNDGTASGGVTYGVAGKVGRAMGFDGANETRVIIGDHSELQLDFITVSAWINSTSAGNFGTIFSKGFGDSAGSGFALYKTGTRQVSWRISGTIFNTAPGLISTNAWHHIVGTYNGAVLRIFINGTQINTVTQAGLSLASARSAMIGSRDLLPGSRNPFMGLIDDVRIYNRALSAAEVQELYQSSSFCTGPDRPIGRVAYNADHNAFQGCTHRGWVAFHPQVTGAGTSCVNPNRPLGTVVYAEDFDVLQGCTKAGWVAFHALTDPCADSPEPGTRCMDGSYYIGDSPADGAKVYMTAAAHQAPIPWHEDPPCMRCGLGDTGATSITDGRLNVEALRAYGGDNATVGNLDGFGAAKYCDNLTDVHGHSDWYLPAGGTNGSSSEINLIWQMVQSAGAVDGIVTTGDWYWSSTEADTTYATNQRFNNGTQTSNAKNNPYRVRCVRR